MEAKHTLRDHKTGPNSKKYRIDNNSMSSFDTPNEMAVKYPNEKQKDYALVKAFARSCFTSKIVYMV